MLVVTDARLRLFEPRDGAYFIDDPDKPGRQGMPAEERLRPLWDAPVSDVRSARVGWHASPEPATTEFTDRSWASFASPFHMGRRKARTVVAALTR